MKQPTDRARRAGEKNGVILSSYHGYFIVIRNEDSLEASLDRALFVAELELPKILEPRLSQHTSNVNTECTGKSEWLKQLYS